MPPPKILPVCCHFMLSLMCAGRVPVSMGFDPHTLVSIVITDSKRIKEVQCGKPNKKLSPKSPEMDGRNHPPMVGSWHWFSHMMSYLYIFVMYATSCCVQCVLPKEERHGHTPSVLGLYGHGAPLARSCPVVRHLAILP